MRRWAKLHVALVAALAALAALGLGACSSPPPARLYTLDAVAPAGPAVSTIRVVVGPVTIPPRVDRPQIVVNDGDNRVQPREFERWAGPLAESIGWVIAQNLSHTLGTPGVWAYPQGMQPKPDVQVIVQVQRFESVPGRSVLIDALWTLRKGEPAGVIDSGRSVVREPSPGAGYEALAASHSRALARVSADIAAAVSKSRP